MYTLKTKRMDMISGLYEMAVYSIGNCNHQHNNFLNDTVPDIVVNQNINYFKLKPFNNENQQRCCEAIVTS